MMCMNMSVPNFTAIHPKLVETSSFVIYLYVLFICASTDYIFPLLLTILLSSSSFQVGTPPVQVPPSLSHYCRHQKPSGTVGLYEPAVHLSCLKHDLIVDDSHFSKLNNVWYSQYLLSLCVVVNSDSAEDVRLVSLTERIYVWYFTGVYFCFMELSAELLAQGQLF